MRVWNKKDSQRIQRSVTFCAVASVPAQALWWVDLPFLWLAGSEQNYQELSSPWKRQASRVEMCKGSHFQVVLHLWYIFVLYSCMCNWYDIFLLWCVNPVHVCRCSVMCVYFLTSMCGWCWCLYAQIFGLFVQLCVQLIYFLTRMCDSCSCVLNKWEVWRPRKGS